MIIQQDGQEDNAARRQKDNTAKRRNDNTTKCRQLKPKTAAECALPRLVFLISLSILIPL